MKTLVMPSRIDNKLKCDGFIIGIKGLSVNMPNYFEIEDLKKIKNKEIFISLNKNMTNSDIPKLKETLIKLNDYNIKGVMFYDLSIPNLYKKLNLNYDLVWNQCHMTTNFNTINIYNDFAKYTWVSNDITLREMIEIKENTTSKLMITLFGYLPIFVSKRHLVKNYLKTFKLKDESYINYIEKEDKIYPVIDDLNGTSVYTDFILNGLKEKLLLDYDYIILNSFLIEDFEKVLDIFNKVNKDNVDKLDKELNKMFNNLKSAFYEEVVYKIK